MVAIHAGCMLSGFLLLTVGASVAMMMRKRGWWLRVHRRFGTTGIMGLLFGLVAALSMVSLQTGQHFAVPHAWLGFVTLLCAMGTYLIGLAQFTVKTARVRPLHRWGGRVTLALLIINILSGLSLAGIL